MKHLKVWTIIKSIQLDTADVTTDFVKEEVLQHFGVRRQMLMDNGPDFIATAFHRSLRTNRMKWRPVSEY